MREPDGQLRDYQLVDLAFYMSEKRCANLSDPGCGKTAPTCVYLYALWAEEQTRTIWVMPKSLLKQNRRVLLEFAPFDESDVIIYDGTPDKRNRIISSTNAKVFLMGFGRFANEWPLLLQMFPDINCLAADEIHLGFGGHSSNRTQEFYQAMERIEKFVALTGTLINGKLDSAYPTIRVIEPRYYASYEQFLYEHQLKDFDGKVIGWKNHEKLGQILRRHTIRRSFTETYGKNTIIQQPQLASMSTRQREVYEEFEAKAYLELGDNVLEAVNGGVMAMRCRQIMAHPEKVKLPVSYHSETGKPIAWKEYNLVGKEMTGKDEMLAITMRDHFNSNEPLIVFGCFHIELERIADMARKIGLRVGVIHGGVPAAKRYKIDDAFVARELDCVIGSGETCGVGYNWGFVDHVNFASIDYKDSNFLQPRRRAERGKREKALRVTVQEYERSIDQRLFSIVNSKSADAHKVDATNEKIRI